MAILLFVLAGGMTVFELAVARHNPCRLYGPAPDEALVSERDLPEESPSLWPIGSVCEWTRADRQGTVLSHVGSYPVTVTIYTVTALGIGLIVAGIVSSRPRRRER